jgi:hypothetical protein
LSYTPKVKYAANISLEKVVVPNKYTIENIRIGTTTSIPFTIYDKCCLITQGQVTGAYIVNLGQQSIEFRVKLAGVTDGSAQGATIAVKFVKNDGATLLLPSSIPLTYVANGVYKATATVTNPFPSGTKFTVKIKGEKHIGVKFCWQASDNTLQCRYIYYNAKSDADFNEL